ncbi:hypothetical protein V8F20_004725 [Naviculisporaceae sp. PSN 640]
MPSFTNFVVLVAMAASLATGFIIPPDQPDGVYVADLEQVKPSSSKEKSGGATLLKARTIPLPVSDSGCPAAGLNVNDYLAAYADFAAWCDKGNKIGGGKVVYSAVGSAVWYGCSYRGENPCDSPEVSDAEKRFNEKCGAAEAAWVYMADWKKTYGRDIATAEICGNIA